MTARRNVVFGLILAGVFSAVRHAHAATCVWTGAGADDNWYTAENWDTGGCPGTVPSGTMIQNHFVIDVSSLILVNVSSPAIEFASLQLGDASGNFSPTLRISSAVNSGGPTTVGNTATLVFNTLSRSSFTALTLLSGSSVTHSGPNTSFASSINLVVGTLDVQAGSTINVNGIGYGGGDIATAGYGPASCAGGYGTVAGGSGSGGGHGGTGGAGAVGVSGIGGIDSQDSIVAPGDYGCGGGGGYYGTGTSTGAAGGGFIRIVASSLTLNGLLTANGVTGGAGTTGSGGGGAGGGINIVTGHLFGSGVLSAQGGGGGSPGGGGGGGGRIAVRVTGTMASTISGFTLTQGASGGGGGSSGKVGSMYINPVHWSGLGAGNSASNYSNWYGTSPIAGNDVIIGQFNASKPCVWDAGSSGAIGTLTVTPAYSGQIDFASPLIVSGTFTMGAGTVTFTSASMNLSVYGHLAQSGGKFNITQGSVTFSGASTQTLSLTPDSTFYHMALVSGSSVSVLSDLQVGGALSVSSGATLTFFSGSTVSLAGDYHHLGAGDGSNTSFVARGTALQNFKLPSVAIKRLHVSNPAGVTLAPWQPVNIGGDLWVDTGSVVNAPNASLSMGGDWSNYGTFSGVASTVSFVSTSRQQNVFAGGSFDFLTVNKAGQTLSLSTSIVVGSTWSVVNGTLDLGSSTHTVLRGFSQSGGLVSGSSSTVIFKGTAPQMVTLRVGSSFNNLIASNTAGGSPSVTFTSHTMITGNLEVHRGALNFPGVALTIKGDYRWMGSVPVSNNTTGSTVTFSGAAPQTLSFAASPGDTLSSVVIDNTDSAGVRLASDIKVSRNFTVQPGRTFDGGSSNLTLTGAGANWSTVNADYRSAGNGQHKVYFQSPIGSSITVSVGSFVDAQVILSSGGTVDLDGTWTLTGFGNSLEPMPGSVLDARSSTITLRDSVELAGSAGHGWSYLHDAGSWIIYQGTGAASPRGVNLSSNTLGNLRVSLTGPTDQFSHPDLVLDGSLIIDQGVFKPSCVANCNKTVSLKGDFIQNGGTVDYLSAGTGTVRLNGASGIQSVSLLPGHSLEAFRIDSGTVTLASGINVRGDLSMSAGAFNAGSFDHALGGNLLFNSSAAFSAQGSTLTLNGSADGKTFQSLTHPAGTSFNGLAVDVASVAFNNPFNAKVFTDQFSGSTLAFAASGIFTMADLRLNGGPVTSPIVVRPLIANTSWNLQLTAASTVTAVYVSSSNAFPIGCTLSTCQAVQANDGKTVDGGGNVHWNFKPFLVLLSSGEAFSEGAPSGKTGTPLAQIAGTPFTLTVRAVSASYHSLPHVNIPVYINGIDDPYAVLPATAALSAGVGTFSFTPRRAESAPFSSRITANSAGAFSGGTTVVPVNPAPYARVQTLLEGEVPAPGTPSGKSGLALPQAIGVPFSVTIRATDLFYNLVSAVTDAVALTTTTAPSSNLPLTATLASGTTEVSGVVMYATGTFTMVSSDVVNGAILPDVSSNLLVVLPSVSSPTVSLDIPNGSTVTTLTGNLTGTASDSSVVGSVKVAVKDIVSGFYYSSGTLAFVASAGPIYGTAVLTPNLGPVVRWSFALPDAAFSNGHRYVVDMRVDNRTGFVRLAYSTFTFNNGLLVFGADDGKGLAVVAPATAAGCQIVIATVTYTAGSPGVGPGGAVALRVPQGWTQPLGLSASNPPPLGYMHIASTSMAASVYGSTSVLVNPASSGQTALGDGWILLQVSSNAASGFNPDERIVFTYTGFPPFGPQGQGSQMFDLRSQGNGSGSLLSVSSSPAILLTPGTTGYISFSDFSPLSLGPLQTSPTMQLQLTDLCGNAKPAGLAVVANLFAGHYSSNSFVIDETADFHAAGGASTKTVTIQIGMSASTSFYFTTSTEGVRYEFIRATATVAPLNNFADSSRLVSLLVSSLTLGGVSIDTGTLTPGSTSIVLTAGSLANAGTIRFSLLDASVPWEVVLSTDPVSFYPPVFQSAGLGNPLRAQTVSWNGINTLSYPSQFVAPGVYKVRIRAGGGVVQNTSLEARVQSSASIYGHLGGSGAWAQVHAAGPNAGFGNFAVASSTGYFRIFGLSAGQAYSVFAQTSTSVSGQAVALSTVAHSIIATPAGTDAGALGFPTPSFVRINVTLPIPAPQELWGSVFIHNADYTSSGFGSIHFPVGSASSDNGAHSFGQSASSWTVLSLPPDTYSIDASLPQLGISTKTPGGLLIDGAVLDRSIVLTKQANIYGYAVLPSTVQFGAWVSVQGVRAGNRVPSSSGGTFVQPLSSTSGTYALYGLDPGSWTITATAPGFITASTQVWLSGIEDIGSSTAPADGLRLSLGTGAVIRGTVTVVGDTLAFNQCLVNGSIATSGCESGIYTLFVRAYNPATYESVAVPIRMAKDAAMSMSTFTLSGISTGTYIVDSSLRGFQAASPGASAVVVTSAGFNGVALTLLADNARYNLEIQLPPLSGGVCRSSEAFRSVGAALSLSQDSLFAGSDITSLTPVQLAGNSYYSPSSHVVETFHCSSMTFSSPVLSPGVSKVRLLYAPTGAAQVKDLVLVHQATSYYSMDLTASSFTVSGSVSLSGHVVLSSSNVGGNFAVTVSSVAGLLFQAPSTSYCLISSSDPVRAKTFHLELIPVDARDPVPPPLLAAPSNATGACRNMTVSGSPPTVLAYIGLINPDGSFQINNVPKGTYLLRNVSDLDLDTANGRELADFQTVVQVTSSVSGVSVTLSQGSQVRGTLSLAPGLTLNRSMGLSMIDNLGRTVQSLGVYFNGTNAVPYVFSRLQDGRYSIVLSDLGFPKVYTAQPRIVEVAGADLSGQDISIVAGGNIKARMAIQRVLADGSRQFSLISPSNRYLLPSGTRVDAIASPWFQGGYYRARTADCGSGDCSGPVMDANNQVIIENMLPGVYNVEFLVPNSSAAATQGANVLVSTVKTGVVVAQGQTADLGVVNLVSGVSLSGIVRDGVSGSTVANVPILARPAVSQPGQDSARNPLPQTVSGPGGSYTLTGLDPAIRFYDVIAAIRGSGQQGDVKPPYEQKAALSVDIQSTATLHFSLTPASFSISGQVIGLSGESLQTAIGPGQGSQSGSTIFLQKADVPPLLNPLADIVWMTDGDGEFTIPGLTPGTYRMTVTALGYESLTFPVTLVNASVNMGSLQLSRGATLTGSLFQPDGSSPGQDTVLMIMAATPELNEFFFGSADLDPVTRTVAGYKLSGFKPHLHYRLLVLGQNNELIAPDEASDVVFSSDNELRNLDIVLRRAKPFVLAKTRRANNVFLLDFKMNQPLRARTSSDDDLAVILTTVSAYGALSGASLSDDRMQLSATYTPGLTPLGVLESSFTLRVRGYSGTKDPDSTDSVNPEFLLDSLTTFYVGLDGLNRTSLNNITGGTLLIEGDAGRVTIPKGSFSIDVSSTIEIGLQKSAESVGVLAHPSASAAEANIRALRYAPQAYPSEVFRAMAASPPELAPFSAFYDIFLPLGVRTALARPVEMCVAYSTGTDPSNLNLYWYNQAANAYILQQDVLGASPVIDTVNRVKCIHINHFSTFVLFNTGVSMITGTGFSGDAVELFNFPNPFDLTVKTVTPIHGAGAQTVRGTMIRLGLPASVSGAAHLKIFNVVGERVRDIDLGTLTGGAYYYQPWDGRNDAGLDVASGVYVGQLKIGNVSKFFKMAVIR